MVPNEGGKVPWKYIHNEESFPSFKESIPLLVGKHSFISRKAFLKKQGMIPEKARNDSLSKKEWFLLTKRMIPFSKGMIPCKLVTPASSRHWRFPVVGRATSNSRMECFQTQYHRSVWRLIQTREQPLAECRGRVLPGRTVTYRWSANPFEWLIRVWTGWL